MVELETHDALVELRVEAETLQAGVERSAVVTPSGTIVVEGDGGQVPATITIRARLSDTSSDAWDRVKEVVAAAKAAGSLHRPGRPVTYLAGLASWRLRPRGTWWALDLTLLPRQLEGGAGTGHYLDIGGDPITIAGRRLHAETEGGS